MEVLVDTKAAIDELGIEMEDYMELCGELKDFIDSTIPQLESIVEAGESKQLEDVAHSLKGALKNLRFIQGGAIAEQLEKIGAGNDEGDPGEVLGKLKIVLGDSIKELNL